MFPRNNIPLPHLVTPSIYRYRFAANMSPVARTRNNSRSDDVDSYQGVLTNCIWVCVCIAAYWPIKCKFIVVCSRV